MKKKAITVMIVDDSFAVNFFNKSVLNDSKLCEEIIEARHGQEALDILNERIKLNLSLPDVIFLDINMPVMDGWKFLEKYEELEASLREGISVYILTTSTNPDERFRSKNVTTVKDFFVKPIGRKVIKHLKDHFISKTNS
jgi:CheY-like chemotaxis protein